MIFSRAAVASTLLLTLMMPLAAHGEWAGKIEQREGVPHVWNPADPAEATVTVELEELWRLGGYSDNDDEFFGVIAQCRQDEDGNVYLLDAQLMEVKVFDADGNFVRTVGRQGEGPGEFQSALDMFLGLDGRVGVVQVWPGKIVQLTREGAPLEQFRLPEVDGGGFQVVSKAEANDERVIVAGSISTRDTQNSYLKAFDADGNELADFHSESSPTQFGGMKFTEPVWTNYQSRWTMAPDGRVFCAINFDDYVITVWNADGSVERVIERELTPLARSGRELKRWQRLYDGITSWNPGSSFEIKKTHMAVNGLALRDDGSLWVLSSYGAFDRPEGIIATYDVFDAEGRFQRQVQLAGEGDASEDGIYFAGDRMYVVTSQFSSTLASLGGEEDEEEEEVEPMSVICYRLDPMKVGMR